MTLQTVRLFPLTGSCLLPQTFLPLNIFEPRYLELVEDALGSDGRIGMVQPVVPADDNRGPAPGAPERPALYPVGCVGEIVQSERQADGRFRVVLEGRQRFRWVEELEEARAYRAVLADLEEFRHDGSEAEEGHDLEKVLEAAQAFQVAAGLEFDWEVLEGISPVRLVNGLSAALPFSPGEKQALLEASTPLARERLLLQLLSIGVSPPALRNDGFTVH